LKVALRFQAVEDEKPVHDWRKSAQLGKVKTEQIKRLGKELMSRFPNKFSSNFDDNKHAVDTLTQGATTKVRNQVAGYITHTISLTQTDSPTETVEEELSA
jgi:small subunit ribosomal protein S17e